MWGLAMAPPPSPPPPGGPCPRPSPWWGLAQGGPHTVGGGVGWMGVGVARDLGHVPPTPPHTPVWAPWALGRGGKGSKVGWNGPPSTQTLGCIPILQPWVKGCLGTWGLRVFLMDPFPIPRFHGSHSHTPTLGQGFAWGLGGCQGGGLQWVGVVGVRTLGAHGKGDGSMQGGMVHG